jgi:hypothetical protein
MVSKYSRGFLGTKPYNFKPRPEPVPGIVGGVPPGGFPPSKKPARKINVALTKKKIPPISDDPLRATQAEKIAAKLNRRMKGVLVERKGR